MGKKLYVIIGAILCFSAYAKEITFLKEVKFNLSFKEYEEKIPIKYDIIDSSDVIVPWQSCLELAPQLSKNKDITFEYWKSLQDVGKKNQEELRKLFDSHINAFENYDEYKKAPYNIASELAVGEASIKFSTGKEYVFVYFTSKERSEIFNSDDTSRRNAKFPIPFR